MTPPCSLRPHFVDFCRYVSNRNFMFRTSTTHFSFIAFCHFLSIVGVKYSTLYFAFCKACVSCGAFPHWLLPPPPGAVQTLWNSMSVGAYFLPRKKITVKGASHGFATSPLTVIFLCGFTETPTEQNVQRACGRHEPTQGF